MSRSSADVVADKRRAGNVIFGEPIAASLASNGTHYYHTCWRHAAGFVLSPPLREDLTTADYLMEMLANGELHCKNMFTCGTAGAACYRITVQPPLTPPNH